MNWTLWYFAGCFGESIIYGTSGNMFPTGWCTLRKVHRWNQTRGLDNWPKIRIYTKGNFSILHSREKSSGSLQECMTTLNLDKSYSFGYKLLSSTLSYVMRKWFRVSSSQRERYNFSIGANIMGHHLSVDSWDLLFGATNLRSTTSSSGL